MSDENEVWKIRLAYEPEWKMYFDGNGGNSLWFGMTKAPNWFHRLMQRLVLGIVWERL